MVFIRDFSSCAATVYGKTATSDAQREYLTTMIKAPQKDTAQFTRLWEEQVVPLAEAYC